MNYEELLNVYSDLVDLKSKIEFKKTGPCPGLYNLTVLDLALLYSTKDIIESLNTKYFAGKPLISAFESLICYIYDNSKISPELDGE